MYKTSVPQSPLRETLPNLSKVKINFENAKRLNKENRTKFKLTLGRPKTARISKLERWVKLINDCKALFDDTVFYIKYPLIELELQGKMYWINT